MILCTWYKQFAMLGSFCNSFFLVTLALTNCVAEERLGACRSLQDAALSINLTRLPSDVDVIAFSGTTKLKTFSNVGGVKAALTVDSTTDSVEIIDKGARLTLPVICSTGSCSTDPQPTSVLTIDTLYLPLSLDLQLFASTKSVRTIYNQGNNASVNLTVLKGIYMVKAIDNGASHSVDNLDCSIAACSVPVTDLVETLMVDTSNLPDSIDLQLFAGTKSVRAIYNQGNKEVVNLIVLKGMYKLKVTDRAASIQVEDINCSAAGPDCSVPNTNLVETLVVDTSDLPTSINLQLLVGTKSVRTIYNEGNTASDNLTVLKGLYYNLKVTVNAASLLVESINCATGSCSVPNSDLVANLSVVLTELPSTVDVKILMGNNKSVCTVYNQGGNIQTYKVLKTDGYSVQVTDAAGFSNQSESVICSDGNCCTSFTPSLPCTDIVSARVDLTKFSEDDVIDICIFSGSTNLKCSEGVGGSIRDYVVDSSVDRVEVALKKSVAFNCSVPATCSAMPSRSLFSDCDVDDVTMTATPESTTSTTDAGTTGPAETASTTSTQTAMTTTSGGGDSAYNISCNTCPNEGSVVLYAATEAKTWSEHDSAAHAMGCEPASITSEAEQQEAVMIVNSFATTYVYIGGFRPEEGVSDPTDGFQAGGWAWSDGLSWPLSDTDGYSNWYGREPNDATENPESVVVLIRIYSGAPWADFVHTAALPALYKCCECTTTIAPDTIAMTTETTTVDDTMTNILDLLITPEYLDNSTVQFTPLGSKGDLQTEIDGTVFRIISMNGGGGVALRVPVLEAGTLLNPGGFYKVSVTIDHEGSGDCDPRFMIGNDNYALGLIFADNSPGGPGFSGAPLDGDTWIFGQRFWDWAGASGGFSRRDFGFDYIIGGSDMHLIRPSTGEVVASYNNVPANAITNSDPLYMMLINDNDQESLKWYSVRVQITDISPPTTTAPDTTTTEVANTDQVVWYSATTSPSWTATDGWWATSKTFCEDQGMSICTLEQICPNAEDDTTVGDPFGASALSDQWVPVDNGDECDPENPWVQIENWAPSPPDPQGRTFTCWTHYYQVANEYGNGVETCPTWGYQDVNVLFAKSYMACCPI